MRTTKDIKNELVVLQAMLHGKSMTDGNRTNVEEKIMKLSNDIIDNANDENSISYDDILLGRSFIASNDKYREILKYFWFTFSVYTDDKMCLTRSGYLKFYNLIQYVVFGNSNEDSSTFLSELSWEHDVRVYEAIDEVIFYDILHDLLSTCIEFDDPLYYAAFGWTVLSAMADVNENPPKIKGRSDIRSIAKRENEASMIARYSNNQELRQKVQINQAFLSDFQDAIKRLGARKRDVKIEDVEEHQNMLELFAAKWASGHNDEVNTDTESEGSEINNSDDDDGSGNRNGSGNHGNGADSHGSRDINTNFDAKWKRNKLAREKLTKPTMPNGYNERCAFLFKDHHEGADIVYDYDHMFTSTLGHKFFKGGGMKFGGKTLSQASESGTVQRTSFAHKLKLLNKKKEISADSSTSLNKSSAPSIIIDINNSTDGAITGITDVLDESKLNTFREQYPLGLEESEASPKPTTGDATLQTRTVTQEDILGTRVPRYAGSRGHSKSKQKAYEENACSDSSTNSTPDSAHGGVVSISKIHGSNLWKSTGTYLAASFADDTEAVESDRIRQFTFKTTEKSTNTSLAFGSVSACSDDTDRNATSQMVDSTDLSQLLLLAAARVKPDKKNQFMHDLYADIIDTSISPDHHALWGQFWSHRRNIHRSMLSSPITAGRSTPNKSIYTRSVTYTPKVQQGLNNKKRKKKVLDPIVKKLNHKIVQPSMNDDVSDDNFGKSNGIACAYFDDDDQSCLTNNSLVSTDIYNNRSASSSVSMSIKSIHRAEASASATSYNYYNSDSDASNDSDGDAGTASTTLLLEKKFFFDDHLHLSALSSSRSTSIDPVGPIKGITVGPNSVGRTRDYGSIVTDRYFIRTNSPEGSKRGTVMSPSVSTTASWVSDKNHKNSCSCSSSIGNVSKMSSDSSVSSQLYNKDIARLSNKLKLSSSLNDMNTIRHALQRQKATRTFLETYSKSSNKSKNVRDRMTSHLKLSVGCV